MKKDRVRHGQEFKVITTEKGGAELEMSTAHAHSSRQSEPAQSEQMKLIEHSKAH